MATACGRSSSNRWSPGRSPTPARPATRAARRCGARRRARGWARVRHRPRRGGVGLAALEDGDLDAAAAAPRRGARQRRPRAGGDGMDAARPAAPRLRGRGAGARRPRRRRRGSRRPRLSPTASEPTYTPSPPRGRPRRARAAIGAESATLTAARAAARNASPDRSGTRRGPSRRRWARAGVRSVRDVRMATRPEWPRRSGWRDRSPRRLRRGEAGAVAAASSAERGSRPARRAERAGALPSTLSGGGRSLEVVPLRQPCWMTIPRASTAAGGRRPQRSSRISA
jgi:hypothetical protein